MKKVKTKKKKQKTQLRTLSEIEVVRTGGQNALLGYSYQQLYSCFLFLTELNNSNEIRCEGIEDIDVLDLVYGNRTYIQIKFSKERQTATFMDGVLKNFLEVFFAAPESSFKLVYDLTVADGNLKKLFEYNLDETSKKFWLTKLNNICIENQWNTTESSLEHFLNSLKFENYPQDKLEQLVTKELIKRCNLNTAIQNLYINALNFFCLKAMKNRTTVTFKKLSDLFVSVQNDIEKGLNNPALSYFSQISFKIDSSTTGQLDYYEGKKATLSDILYELPVRRTDCEKEIEDSIDKNTITVIKASSGQGKTTLAWQICYNLRNDFSCYQLSKCDEQEDIYYITDFIKTRISLGSKILLLLDNLNVRLKLWDELVQRLEQEVSINYKVLVTAREDDWYSFSGELYNVKSLNVVNILLDEHSAEQIFYKLQKNNMIHSSVKDWHGAWEQIQNRKLLIEYIYLLTHGQMISERIDDQIKKLGNSTNGKLVCKILRYVCFADVCGIQLQTNKLFSVVQNESTSDLPEVLKSLDKEFLIKIDTANGQKYIDGLHPVRSQHIIERLHEFISIDETVLQVIKIVDKEDLNILSSFLPMYVEDKESFYKYLVDFLDNDCLSYNSVFVGIFSGTAINYYRKHKELFDEANQHYGLELFCLSANPFISDNNFIDQLCSIQKNENLEELKNLCQKPEKLDIEKTDIYIFSRETYRKLHNVSLIEDIDSFIKIAEHLFFIDKKFILADKLDLKQEWNNREHLSLTTVELLFYISFLETPTVYYSVTNLYKKEIFSYIKEKTNSLKLYENDKDIYVEYVVCETNLENINAESFNRLKTIARILPIYEHYCSNVCKPKITLFSAYELPNLGVKAIPLDTFSKIFKSDYVSLWDKSILSNYEAASVYEWLRFWINTRQTIITNLQNCYKLLCYRLKCESGNSFINNILSTRLEINNNLGMYFYFPHSKRPFEKTIDIAENFDKKARNYFSSINNFINQFSDLLCHKENQKLAFLNLCNSCNNLSSMQEWFVKFCDVQKIFINENAELCKDEINILKKIRDVAEFYLEQKPSEYFSTTSVLSYHDKKEIIFLKQIEECLSSLKANFSVIFPNAFINDGLLKIYPLVVNEFNFNDEERMNLFTLCLSSLASQNESQISFVKIAFINNDGVITFGLSFSFECMRELFDILNGKEEANIEKPPFPLSSNSFDNQFISCFDMQLKIQEIKKDTLSFVKILSKLWEYSKYRENLKEDSDIKYLQSKLKNIITEIDILSNDLDKAYIQIVQDLCAKVYRGMGFDDSEYNKYYNIQNK